MRKTIEKLLANDLTSNKIATESGVTPSKIYRLRSGETNLDNITLAVAEKLYNYQKELEMDEMKSPKRNEIVEVIDNASGKVLAKGKLTAYTPHRVTLEQSYDAKTVHFKGYEPKDMIKRD